MAKTPKSKLARPPPSTHSRAARRAEAPPTKTLLSQVTAVEDYAPKAKSTIPAHHNAGISKRKTKNKPLSRSKRIRQEKGMRRAVDVLDQLDIKKTQSAGKEKKIRERGAAWDDLNERLFGKKENKVPAPGAEDDGWRDESEADDEQDAKEAAVLEGVTALKVDGEKALDDMETVDAGGGKHEEEDEVL